MTRFSQERRLHPRIAQKLPVKIAANGYDFSTTTENLSAVGAYCSIDKYIPPFTKIAVKMNLPIQDRQDKGCSVECKGVIVRTEDNSSGGFNIAIFFNDIKDSQQKRISRYINQFLP